MTAFDFEAGLSEGDNVAIRVGESIKFFKLMNKDNLLLVSNLSAVTNGTTSAFTQITALNPPDDELIQVNRMELVKGNVEVLMRHPTSTNRWGTESSPTGGFMTDKCDEVPTNLWIFEDFVPSISIVNDTNVSITPAVRWVGWRYLIRPLKEQPLNYKLVSIGGLSR